ncbi:tautomerase family protein [Pseudoxanthomonas mexicana]|jgi:4-oxalocrotonate tautomerase|nr:tautomerase family protein [Pseudoxanthomonas mexicana]
MPHVIVKLWPGKTEQQKQRLADRLCEAVMEELGYG